MTHQEFHTIRILFRLAQRDEPANIVSVAARLGTSCWEATAVLDALEQAGLVDAERVRLTLAGLAIGATSAAGARPAQACAA